MLDSRLFNRESLSSSFGNSDSYNLYDKPLFSGSSAAAAIYKPRGKNVDDEGYELAEEEAQKAMKNDRFGLGVAGRGFDGADTSEVREGSVPLVFLVAVLVARLTRVLLQTCRVRTGHGGSVRSRRVLGVCESGTFGDREEARTRSRWRNEERGSEEAREGMSLTASMFGSLLGVSVSSSLAAHGMWNYDM